MTIEGKDYEDLKQAVESLEFPSFISKITSNIEKPAVKIIDVDIGSSIARAGNPKAPPKAPLIPLAILCVVVDAPRLNSLSIVFRVRVSRFFRVILTAS